MLTPPYFYIFVFLGTFLLTALIWRYAKPLHLIAEVEERSSHNSDIATGGGAAFAISFLFILWAGFKQHYLSFDLTLVLGCGGLLLSAIGFWDDVKPLPIRFRLVTHTVVTLWAIYWLGEFPVFILGNWQLSLGHVAPIVTFLLMIWLINLYNFMDGIDGLAGIQAMTVAISSALIALTNHQLANFWLYSAITVMMVGFLVWNFPKAKIFMGDVGSSFLGYLFGVLILQSSHVSSHFFWVFTILFGVFLVDASFTLLRRVLTGEPFYQPHRTHSYQLLAQQWKSHQKVTSLVFVINLFWLLPCAMIANLQPKYSFLITLLALAPIFSGCLFLQIKHVRILRTYSVN